VLTFARAVLPARLRDLRRLILTRLSETDAQLGEAHDQKSRNLFPSADICRIERDLSGPAWILAIELGREPNIR